MLFIHAPLGKIIQQYVSLYSHTHTHTHTRLKMHLSGEPWDPSYICYLLA